MISSIFLTKSQRAALEPSYLLADKNMMWILLGHAFVAVFITSSYYHTYWLGIVGSLAIMTLCTVSYVMLRGTLWFRLIAAVAVMMFTAIFIQQHLGRIEMHFHVFIGLAILTIYKDTLPMLMASGVTIAYHFLFNWLQSNQLYIGQDPIMVFSYGCGIEYVYLHGVMVAAEVIVLVYIINDSTKQHLNSIQAEKNLKKIAYYDSLTALPNRVLLADRLHQAMSQTHRRAQSVAVVYLDLDGFKTINDAHGHNVGDQMLIALSDRMKHTLRDGDTLARIGGDEFVAILVDLKDTAESDPIISRLLVAASQPVQLGDLSLCVSASLGITFYPQSQESDADLLLRQADQAMYQAKLAGKNRFYIFDTEHDISIRSHNESLEHIRMALNANEFVLFYQPKVNMRTGKVIGVEALIRWEHPQKGLLAPALFLPTIENHPLANELGEWVINAALTQMKLWHDQGLDIRVSVNIGAFQLNQENFVERLKNILSLYPTVKPSFLELEVLETSALENIDHVYSIMKECREVGVEFALDDFGTGYSSLTYLKRLPIDMLKIDQSFVRDMLDDPDDLAILEGVIGLATAFRRKVIAEGVETVEHGEMLLQLGCDLAQGYGISRPMPADQFLMWVNTWKADPKWTNLSAVNATDISLLYANVEHRAWISATEAFLKGEHEAPVEQDHNQCRLGNWMSSTGLEHYGNEPYYHDIEVLHQSLHELVKHLHELHAQNKNAEVLLKLDELHTLRDTLLEKIKLILQVN